MLFHLQSPFFYQSINQSINQSTNTRTTDNEKQNNKKKRGRRKQCEKERGLRRPHKKHRCAHRIEYEFRTLWFGANDDENESFGDALFLCDVVVVVYAKSSTRNPSSSTTTSSSSSSKTTKARIETSRWKELWRNACTKNVSRVCREESGHGR